MPTTIPRAVILAILLLAVATPAIAPTAASYDARIARLVAMPTPAGPVSLGSDRATWEVIAPAQTAVWMEAHAPPNSPFHLSASCASGFAALPTTSDFRFCGGSDVRETTFTLSIDPAAGVAVDIRLHVRGHVSDIEGGPAAFTIRQVEARDGCVVPGVCLP